MIAFSITGTLEVVGLPPQKNVEVIVQVPAHQAIAFAARHPKAKIVPVPA